MPRDSRDDPTLPDTSSGTTDPVPRLSDVGIDRRYDLGTMLGRGGMGEVRNATDLRIHREVAVKLLRSATADEDTKARFFREAQVQGRLEHPAIPPVHDLGIDRDGQPYFVMKKLAGWTLLEVLETRTSSAQLAAKFPRQQLLNRLVDVCLAIEFAHARSIVHRDLKPANIMLGEYGETYVLDWGLARVTSDEVPIKALSGDVEAGHTAVGALLGTPGYMAPEQARGEIVDARADVYALGCILYEILTGAFALPRGIAGIEATLTAVEHRPSKRVDVAPELDDLCARATAQDRTKRPTARELADGIQRYLDGDRDLERRRELANEHVARATKFLEQPGDEARADAMREASRAMVLDATNKTAQTILAKLVLEAPDEMPQGALADADLARAMARQKVLRAACLTYASVILLLAVLIALFPIKRYWPFAATTLLCGVMSAFYFVLSRQVLPMKSRKFEVLLVLNTLLLIAGAYIFGPMLILPIFVIGSLAGMIMAPTGYSPALIVAAHSVAFLVPVGLEIAGVTETTFIVENGALVMMPYAIDLTPVGAIVILVLSVASQFVNTTTIGWWERRSQEQALNRVHAQSWHFKQLLPKAGATGERSQPPAKALPPAPPSRDA